MRRKRDPGLAGVCVWEGGGEALFHSFVCVCVCVRARARAYVWKTETKRIKFRFRFCFIAVRTHRFSVCVWIDGRARARARVCVFVCMCMWNLYFLILTEIVPAWCDDREKREILVNLTFESNAPPASRGSIFFYAAMPSFSRNLNC